MGWCHTGLWVARSKAGRGEQNPDTGQVRKLGSQPEKWVLEKAESGSQVVRQSMEPEGTSWVR